MITKNKTVNQLTDKQLIKWALEESPVPYVRNPYLKKAITDAEIQKKLDKQRGPSDWEIIYDGMSPYEKGSWNYEKRKQGMDGKTGDVLEKKKPAKPVKIDINISPSRRVAKKPKKPKPLIELLPGLEHFDWQLAPWEDYPADDDAPPPDEDTSIPIEEKINKRIAKQKLSEGLAYLLGQTI